MAIPQLSPYEIPPLPTNQAAHWQLDPKRAALLVHDMQEYFIAAYDRNANPMSTVLSNIQSIISFADGVFLRATASTALVTSRPA